MLVSHGSLRKQVEKMMHSRRVFISFIKLFAGEREKQRIDPKEVNFFNDLPNLIAFLIFIYSRCIV